MGERIPVTVRAASLGVLGILSIIAWSLVVGGLVGLLFPGEVPPQLGTALSTVALGAGTASVVALHLHRSERDLSFLDLQWPTARELVIAFGGVVAVFGANIAIGVTFQRLGIESASHSVFRTAQSEPTVLLVLVPLSYLLIAPGEELLYRNVVQKHLRQAYSPVGAVVVASAIFAAVHIFAYSGPGESLLSTLNTLAIIFVLALVLGAVYEHTKNVVVPILVHGTFNAVAFVVTYVQLTRMPIG